MGENRATLPPMYEYRIVLEGHGATYSPLNAWDRAEANRIADKIRSGRARDLFNVPVPAQRAFVEYRTVTDWAPVRGATDPTKPNRP